MIGTSIMDARLKDGCSTVTGIYCFKAAHFEAVIWDSAEGYLTWSPFFSRVQCPWFRRPVLGPLSLNEVYMETSSQSGMSNFGGDDVYIH